MLDIQSIEQIEKLEMELTKLRKSVKKETQFSKQYELSQKIAKCKEEIEGIKHTLFFIVSKNINH